MKFITRNLSYMKCFMKTFFTDNYRRIMLENVSVQFEKADIFVF